MEPKTRMFRIADTAYSNHYLLSSVTYGIHVVVVILLLIQKSFFHMS
jgi:hypothetical protein